MEEPAKKRQRTEDHESNQTENGIHLLELDSKILQVILWHMPDLPTLLRFSFTCKRLLQVTDDESFWRAFLLASLYGETRMVLLSFPSPPPQQLITVGHSEICLPRISLCS